MSLLSPDLKIRFLENLTVILKILKQRGIVGEDEIYILDDDIFKGIKLHKQSIALNTHLQLYGSAKKFLKIVTPKFNQIKNAIGVANSSEYEELMLLDLLTVMRSFYNSHEDDTLRWVDTNHLEYQGNMDKYIRVLRFNALLSCSLHQKIYQEFKCYYDELKNPVKFIDNCDRVFIKFSDRVTARYNLIDNPLVLTYREMNMFRGVYAEFMKSYPIFDSLKQIAGLAFPYLYSLVDVFNTGSISNRRKLRVSNLCAEFRQEIYVSNYKKAYETIFGFQAANQRIFYFNKSLPERNMDFAVICQSYLESLALIDYAVIRARREQQEQIKRQRTAIGALQTERMFTHQEIINKILNMEYNPIGSNGQVGNAHPIHVSPLIHQVLAYRNSLLIIYGLSHRQDSVNKWYKSHFETYDRAGTKLSAISSGFSKVQLCFAIKIFEAWGKQLKFWLRNAHDYSIFISTINQIYVSLGGNLKKSDSVVEPSYKFLIYGRHSRTFKVKSKIYDTFIIYYKDIMKVDAKNIPIIDKRNESLEKTEVFLVKIESRKGEIR